MDAESHQWVITVSLRRTFLKPGFSGSHQIHVWQYTVKHLKLLICPFSRCTAQVGHCYYTGWRVLKRSSVSHIKHHVKFKSEWVVTTIVEVLECGECSMVCRSQCTALFVWLFSRTLIATSFIYMYTLREVHFCAELIGDIPVIIACDSGKLFLLFY